MKRKLTLICISIAVITLCGCTKTATYSGGETDIVSQTTADAPAESTSEITTQRPYEKVAEELIVNLDGKIISYLPYQKKSIPLNPEELSTAELYNDLVSWGGMPYIAYNYPSYLVLTLPSHFLTKEAATELFAREDFLETAIYEYKRLYYFENIGEIPNQNNDNPSYSLSAWTRDYEIGFAEIMLADENSFDKLSDEQKTEVLDELKNKLKAKHFDTDKADESDYITTSKSPFLMYVCEQKRDGKTKWYDYIKANDDYAEFMPFLDNEHYCDGGFR